MINKLSSQHEDFDSQLSSLISLESVANNDVNKIVDEIIVEIQNKGDKALLNYTVELDLVKVNSISDLIISKEKLKKSFDDLDDIQKNALTISADRIKSYHQKQFQKTWTYKDEDGTVLGQKITPLDRVGLYVPGGKAAYPSSVLMNAIPAKVAGVQ